tara:strand:+ start:1324 stop:1905 length:582 start_codon:yes stop_codon:yes gene_type:complete
MEDNFRKLNIHFDASALKDAYNYAAGEIGFSGQKVNCISLTHSDKSENDTRGIFWMQDDNYNEIQVERFVNEDAYRIFEPLLMQTYFKNVYDTLSNHFQLGRVRILKLESRTSLSYHRDPENRLHIPIVTNPGALMVVENDALHMKADGSVYYMNTTKYHTALNGGVNPRIHLVATILDENREEELYEVYGGD